MFAGDGEGEHFGVVGSGAFPASDFDVGSSLVRVGVAAVGNVFKLGSNLRGSANMVNSCPRTAITLRTVAEIYVNADALGVSAFTYLIVAIVDVSYKTQTALLIGGRNGVDVNSDAGVF